MRPTCAGNQVTRSNVRGKCRDSRRKPGSEGTLDTWRLIHRSVAPRTISKVVARQSRSLVRTANRGRCLEMVDPPGTARMEGWRHIFLFNDLLLATLEGSRSLPAQIHCAVLRADVGRVIPAVA